MRCGKLEHQPGQKCAAKNAKCKECHKIGHFHKVCQSKKRGRRVNLVQTSPQSKQDTHIDENGVRQPNPPLVNMLKIVNHIGATKGPQEKHLKFPIVDPRGPYKHHLVVRVDTGADVNCMNEKTFKRLFPKVKLSVCPHEIQNFGNSVADISILGQFCTYLQFRGEKYLNAFIVTNANDCPNLLSHGATFRMGVLLPNYPEENVVKGENVLNFKINTGASSNVLQILQDLRLEQYKGQYHSSTVPSTVLKQHKEQFHSSTTPNTMQKQYEGPYHSSTTPGTALQQYDGQHHSSTVHIDLGKPSSASHMVQNMAQLITSFRTTTPSTAMTGRTTTKQVNPVQVHPETSRKALLEHCMHVHQPTVPVCKPGESLALRKVKHPHNGRTSVNRLPLTKQDILSQYSGCFEGIGHFPEDPYKFHLKPEHKPARHAPRKVLIHLESAFKEEIESLVKQEILEEVKEHTDW